MNKKWISSSISFIALSFLGLFCLFIAVSSASFGVEFHHDYFSIISAYLQSLGLAPHTQAYNHYGLVDSTLKEFILKISGKLISVKISYVIINFLSCLLIILSAKGRRLRLFLGTFSLLWLVLDPSLLGIKDFSGFLATLSPTGTKLTKLAWSSDLVNLLGALWIFTSIRMYRDLQFTWVLSNRKTIFYALFSGLIVTLSWLTKFTLGAAFLMAVLISFCTLILIRRENGGFPKIILYFLAGVFGSFLLITSTYQIWFDGFFSAYFYQTFTVQKEFFGVFENSGGVGLLLQRYLDILKEKLLGHQIWWLASFFLGAILFVKANISPNRVKRFIIAFVATIAGFYLYKGYGHSVKSIDSIVSFLFTSSIIIWIICIENIVKVSIKERAGESILLKNELYVLLVFLTPISYLSLLQIAPLGDPLHIWWSSLFLFNLIALQCEFFCNQIATTDESGKIILAGILVCTLTYVCLQINHSYKELDKLNNPSTGFVKLGKEYGLLEGLRVDKKSKQGLYLINFNLESVGLTIVTGPNALPELLSDPMKYAEWNRCLGAPLNIVRKISAARNRYSDNLSICLEKEIPEFSKRDH